MSEADRFLFCWLFFSFAWILVYEFSVRESTTKRYIILIILGLNG